MITTRIIGVVLTIGLLSIGPAQRGSAQGCVENCGDIDHDGSMSASDLAYFQNYLFLGGPAPICLEEAAAWDSHELVTFSDEVFLVNWLFSGDFPPICPPPAGPLDPPVDESFSVVIFEGLSGAALEVPAGATSHELLLMYDFDSPVEAFLAPLGLRVGTDLPTVAAIEWGDEITPDAGFRFLRDDGNGDAVIAAHVMWLGELAGYGKIARLTLDFPASAQDRTISIDFTTMPPVENSVDVHSPMVMPDGWDPSSHRTPLLDFDCCVVRGDMNVDGELTVSDITQYVCFLFDGGCTEYCAEAADFDNSGVVNISDLTGAVDFLFRGGDAPPPCR